MQLLWALTTICLLASTRKEMREELKWDLLFRWIRRIRKQYRNMQTFEPVSSYCRTIQGGSALLLSIICVNFWGLLAVHFHSKNRSPIIITATSSVEFGVRVSGDYGVRVQAYFYIYILKTAYSSKMFKINTRRLWGSKLRISEYSW